MLAYKYDETTKEYLGTQEAQINPLEGGYLLPANCTFTTPPEEKTDKARVWVSDEWAYVDDFRSNYYKVDSNLDVSEITHLGDIEEGYIKVTKEFGNEIKANPNNYVIDNCSIREKTEEEKQAEEAERVNNLTMTPLDFIKVLESMGLSLAQITTFLDENLEIKTQLTYCNSVYCGVVKQFLPIEIGGVTITAQMVEQAFKQKNGVE